MRPARPPAGAKPVPGGAPRRAAVSLSRGEAAWGKGTPVSGSDDVFERAVDGDAEMAGLALVMGQELPAVAAGIGRSLLPIYIYDPATLRFLAANAAALRLYGYSEAELLHLTILDIRPAEEISHLKTFLAEGWPPGVRDGGIWCHRAKCGRVFKVRLIAMNTPYRGQPARLVVAEEMTPNTYAIDGIAQLLFPFAEQMEDAAWIRLLRNGRYVYLNPAFEKVFGLPRADAFDDPGAVYALTHADDLPAWDRNRLEQAAGPAELEFRIRRRDGSEPWLQMRSFLLRDAAGEMMCAGITKDISERKLAERARLAACQAQRDALVREVHHRIKNTLQGVVGLLRQSGANDAAAAPTIERAIVRMRSVALVHGLLGRAAGSRPALAELLACVVASVETARGTAPEVRVRPADGRATLCDSAAVPVALAVNELVTNAIKHRAGAGVVRITLDIDAAARRAELRISNPGRLPQGFPREARETGIGIGLVTTLLAGEGARLDWRQRGGRVEARLCLLAPLLS